MKWLLVILGMILFFEFAEAALPPADAVAPTFQASQKRAQYSLGLIKAPSPSRVAPSKEFLLADEVYPSSLDWRSKITLSPIKNQGSCGSCVYFATTSTFEDSMRMRGTVIGPLAPQWLMDCAAPNSSCNGSWFEEVAGGLVKKGGEALESDYPYRARNQSCQGSPQLYGKIASFKLIDNSAKSIIAALNKGYAVATTIGAGGNMMNYDSGIMNGCQNIGTNHEMSIVGYNCGTAIEGVNCKLDANGNLPASSGAYWIIRNSWGTSYGEEGFLRIVMRSQSGGLCNNVTEEVGILETGITPVPPKPPEPPVPPAPKPFEIPSWAWILGIAGVVGLIIFIVSRFKKK